MGKTILSRASRLCAARSFMFRMKLVGDSSKKKKKRDEKATITENRIHPRILTLKMMSKRECRERERRKSFSD